ncbi:MAG TPA: dihydrolipoyl dehydrogenase [Tepidisphaeraceae bacterium]|jgi:dihydrolipoamide dehydrogenase|nr:dihydrolipoyl dehydrogenase [Tepidisphaeraceae bacterium]
MSETNFDLIVIGAGPGGYVAAIRAAQLGLKTACVEREFLGGTCLNIGCIPSKALLDSSERYFSAKNQFARHGIKIGDLSIDLPTMMTRKQDVVSKLTGGVGMLFKKNEIEHLKGNGTITAPDTVQVTGNDGATQTYKANRILIATGSAPIEIPGLKFDGKNILSSTEALSLSEIPKKMIVIGGGYIGVEMSSVWNRLGTEILVLEFLERILPPSDNEMALGLQRLLEKQGIKFRFKTIAESAKVENGKVKVAWKAREGSETGVEEVDKVLVCVGRRPITDKLGLDKVGVAMDKKGFITVDKNFQTNVPGIYAIGDVIGGIMLAHKAEEEGTAAVELMAGKAGHVNYACCPAVVYTHPELASVGLTEEEAKQRGEIKIGKFPFTANGRARGMDETDGQVKVIADAKTDRILGVHILAAHASDMIAEAVVAMEFHASSEDLARTFHAHPTLPEAVKEAALAVEKRAIHF